MDENANTDLFQIIECNYTKLNLYKIAEIILEMTKCAKNTKI